MHMAGAPLLDDLRLRNRSVDDVAAYGDDSMNVWQTLEVISGNNLRKKYHYDGYSDAGNLLRLLTPCALHRESYGDNPTAPEQPKEFGAASGGGPRKDDQVAGDPTQVAKDVSDKKKRATAARDSRRLLKGKDARNRAELKEKDELLRLTTECTDLVQCSFNIPRISARLERLMGTNVVRLTDRKYMRELREAIDDDHRVQLMNRIKDREIKELERERNLILEGKTDTIPEELSGDPIFVVNKRANIEILKRRAKLKTNREKNADRLLRQGQKWERERLRYKEEEVAKQQQQSKVNSEQRALENQYREEDARRGLDLLRINDAEWQDCELSLRDFLHSERDKMKERSWRVPTQFSSDPLDIRNVIRARKLFREEQRLKRLEELQREKKMQKRPKRSIKKLAKNVQRVVQAVHRLSYGLFQEERADSVATMYLGDDEASGIPSSGDSREVRKHAQPDIKQQKVKLMEEQVQDDVNKGYLVTKEQHSNLRYADPMIDKLRDSANIRDLYLVAEKIITYDVEEEQIPEEEFEIEEDDED